MCDIPEKFLTQLNERVEYLKGQLLIAEEEEQDIRNMVYGNLLEARILRKSLEWMIDERDREN